MSAPPPNDLGFPVIDLPRSAERSRDDAIRFLVAHLVGAGQLREECAEDAIRALLRREQLGSTGIGNGVAIPHAKIHGIAQVVGVIGPSQTGVPWDAVDSMPVHRICLFLSPIEQPGLHLRVLERVARLMRPGE